MMEQPISEKEISPHQAYSRTTLLEPDAHAGALRRTDSPADSRADVNRKKALNKVLNERTYITADLERVIYGSFDRKPACLILFNFKFRFEADSHLRFKRAEIAVSFKATPDSLNKPAPGDDPVIYNFAPKKMYGNLTVENLSWTYGIELPCMVSIGPAEVGVQPYMEKTSSFQKGYRMEIFGREFKDARHNEENEVIWTVKENSQHKNGIPDQLKFAIILGHKGRFQADIKVSAETGSRLKLFGWPWSKDDPVLFQPPEGFGMPLEIPRWFPDLETIKNEEWAELVPQWKEWESQIANIG
ncbi:hypothetical protein Q9L58_009614 [Maublancomyces gigas]|uniref:Uncharacterized protein n=1 Tax=Discina gigas TaxID=1032678 RepID=A0ABR3G6E7_9PEZI